MISRRGVLAGIIGMCVPTALLYVDGYWNVQLAVLIGTVWGLVGWLLSCYGSMWKQMDRRVSVLIVFLLVAVPQFGIHAELSVPADLQIALWYLFMGAGLAFWGLGVKTASETPAEQYQRSPTSAD